MEKLTREQFMQIRNWMCRNARPLEIAKWKYHFEYGSREEVVDALAAYQNKDGGFGNALEPDSWNPNSSPISTTMAVGILDEIDFRDQNHPIVKGILRYLDNTPGFTGKYWPAVIPTNDHFPHAPWWTYSDNFVADWGYNPTAKLAGFILLFAERNSGIYAKAAEIAKEGIHQYLYGVMPDGRAYRAVYREAEVDGFHYLLECLEESGITNLGDLPKLKQALKEQADAFMEKDPSKWGSYCQKPSVFITSPDSMFLEGNEEAVEAELNYLLSKRNPDGVWDIVWSWGAYEREFAISENWWKAIKAIEYLLLLKNFDRA